MTLLRRPDAYHSPVAGLRTPLADEGSNPPPLALALWLDGVEQVECTVGECKVADGRTDNYDGVVDEDIDATTTTSGGTVKLSTRWECSDLRCSCIPGTMFCGGTEDVSRISFFFK